MEIKLPRGERTMLRAPCHISLPELLQVGHCVCVCVCVCVSLCVCHCVCVPLPDLVTAPSAGV